MNSTTKERIRRNRNSYGGINYAGFSGFSGSNKDTETGIAYGLISPQSVASWIWDYLEPVYTAFCPETGSEIKDFVDDEVCSFCDQEHTSDDVYGDEADCHTYEDENLKLYTSGDCTEIWVFKSPHYTWAQYCSPCMPGAGNLNMPTKPGIGVKTYALSKQWFDDYSPCSYRYRKITY